MARTPSRICRLTRGRCDKIPETNYMSHFTHSREGAFVSESSGVSPQNICAASLWQRAWGVPEVVAHGETGLLVETNDSHGIAEATLRLLECPELATQIGQAARRRAQRMFSWQSYVSAHNVLYQKIITDWRQKNFSRTNHRFL